MLFYYDENGNVDQWWTHGIIFRDCLEEAEFFDEQTRQWERWHADHELVIGTPVVHSMVKTTFSGLGEPGGMFYTTAYDARGKEMDQIQCLTMDRAISNHKRLVEQLQQSHGTAHGEYYPSRP